MPATLRDVAREAGVSIRTVSRVVNGLEGIREETRAHVQEVIDRLGYRPNVLVRSLRAGRTATVGMVTPHIAAGTRDALTQKMRAAFANLVRFTRGEPLRNVVPELADLCEQE